MSDTATEPRRASHTGNSTLPGVIPLTKRRACLQRAVEEADWLGETERMEFLYEQLVYVKDQIAKGYLYEPEF